MRITYAYNHCVTILAATVTTTLSNGETTVVGSIIYQYGNNDINGNGNAGNDNGGGGSPASTGSASKSSAIRQVAHFLRSAGGWGWGIFALVTTVMVVAA
jgi:hypothetical protein